VNTIAAMPRVRRPEDLPSVAAVLRYVQVEDTVRHETANLLRRSGWHDLTGDLLAILENPGEKERFRSFAVQHLWLQLEGAGGDERKRIAEALRRFLGDRHRAVRREALQALVRMGDPLGERTAAAWLEQPDEGGVTVRDLAIRCLAGELDRRQHIAAIRRCARDENISVRLSALQALGAWKDEPSRAAFEEAVASQDRTLKETGKAALKKLDGETEKSGEIPHSRGTP
jgi:HEAT repeat protein